MKILVLGRASDSTSMLLETLIKNKHFVFWGEERRNDGFALLLKRCNRLGYFKVAGQIVFFLLVYLLKITSARRKDDILKEFDFEKCYSPIFTVEDLNSKTAINKIKELDFELVILSGTRILTNNFLREIGRPIINIHAGITPKYRGVHGGYWSLVENDESNFGATIHLVDEGIDTGKVLAYVIANKTKKDNFTTYPLLQQKAALKVLPAVLDSLQKPERLSFEVNSRKSESSIWTHPTIFQYIFNRVWRGIR